MIKSKELFDLLLTPGYYIAVRQSHNRKHCYCLYRNKSVPVVAIASNTFNKVEPMLKEKEGKFTLDLRLIRSMHGNSSEKRKYKQALINRKKLDDGTRNNKTEKGIQIQ